MILLWSVLALVFLLGAGFFSGAEMGLYSLNRLRLRLRVGRTGDPAAQALLDLSDHRERSVLAILLTQNIMNYLLAVAAVSLIMEATHMSNAAAEVYAAIILSPVAFVFGDVVPKNWFRAHANRLMYPTVRLVQGCVNVFRYSGVLWILEGITRLLAHMTGQDASNGWRSARGEILDDMEHEGWARIHSEQWRVRSSVPLKRGSRVRVRARHDLILDVEPLQGE